MDVETHRRELLGYRADAGADRAKLAFLLRQVTLEIQTEAETIGRADAREQTKASAGQIRFLAGFICETLLSLGSNLME